MKKQIPLVTLLLIIFTNHLFCSVSNNSVQDTLTIGVNQAAPFAFKEGKSKDGWKGISIQLWEKIAEKNNWNFKYKEYELKQLITALENGKVDATASPLAITPEREEAFSFSYPYYYTGIGIATRAKESGWGAIIKSIFSIQFIKAIGSLSLVILIFGFLLWLFERKKNAGEFGGTQGIGSGFWWSAVTMTTVGYGDKTPKTLGGRIIGLIWMFMGIIIISGFTAAIASSLTVNELSAYINSPEDLRKVKSGTVSESSSEKYLQEKGLNYTTFASIGKALEALKKEKVGAVVYDEPILKYLLRHKISGEMIVLNKQVQKSYYAFGIPEDSPLRKRINIELVREMDKESWNSTLYQYLGNTN